MGVARFGPFKLDFRTRLLHCNGAIVPLGPKVVQTLMVLVERGGQLVTKDELMSALWPNVFVEEANISQNVYRLRRVLSANGMQKAIETLPGRGYRFAARSQVQTEPAPDRSTRRPFFVVGVIASAVVLAAALAPPKQSNVERLSAESRAAYRLGLYHLNLRLDDMHARYALRYFAHVARMSPTSALGFAGMADAYLAIFDAECDSSVVRCRNVVRAGLMNAQRAVRIDPASAEAHTALAMALNEFHSDDRAAEAEFRTAIALDPSYALAHHWYGNLLTVQGRYAESMSEHRTALALDPTSPATYKWLAEDAFLSNDYAHAVAFAHQAAAVAPLNHPTIVLMGLAYERLGRLKEAQQCFARLRGVEARALRAALLARQGQRVIARRLLVGIGQMDAIAAGATEALAFAWIALGDPSRAYNYLRATPLPNRVERNLLARDPRWKWAGNGGLSRRWIQPG